MYVIFLLFLVISGYCASIESEIATFDKPTRLLLLDGDDGTVACRIYGSLMSATIPKFSENWRLESATRSLLRMQNLTAVRGIPGASMVGPLDYLGNLEKPHAYLYTIREEFPPAFFRTPLLNQYENHPNELQEFDVNFLTLVKAKWIRGKEKTIIQEKQLEYNITPKHLKQSLFLDPGLLEIDRNLIELLFFDPREVDFSSFKARLVFNQTPFQITQKALPSKDEYRIITYFYEPLYQEWQIQNGSGLFLEQHQFSQTITPLTPDSKGYVILARTKILNRISSPLQEGTLQLEMIGIQIPYGYTLIIEEGCIHGDTTLNGFFMMGMTSDHTTMRTANTVFLKYPPTKDNVKTVMMGMENTPPADTVVEIPPPYVIYKNATEIDRAKFRELTDGQNFVFNPFSREYWQCHQ